jgi:hypothetical protein
MNKILVPRITFKNIVADEKRIETAYARLFVIARRNILAKRQLTNGMASKYTKVQYGGEVFNN